MFKVNIIFGLSLLLALLGALVGFTGLYGIDGPFIIHFNNLGMADLIGGKEFLNNVIFIGLTILIVNFVLARRLYGKHAILAYILSWGSLFVSLSVLLTAYLISRVN